MPSVHRVLCSLVLLAMSAGSVQNLVAREKEVQTIRVYVGTYTQKGSQGIYLFEFDPRTGKPGGPRVVAEAVNPSFVALDPARTHLYAVNEVSDFGVTPAGRGTGGVTAFAIDPQTGALTMLNRQPSGGVGACHVCVDLAGKNVLVANYGAGTAASLHLNPDGSLQPAATVVEHKGHSVNPRRQEAPHAHSANASPDNRFAFIADLGLDQILIYKLDVNTGTLMPNDPPSVATKPGAGPRHFAFHPNGKYAYNNNELDWTVVAYAYDAQRGALQPLQTLTTVPEDFSGTGGTAETLVHPSGKFVYVSNRGPDSIAIYQVNSDGTLQPRGFASTLGKIPRNFGIDPTGQFLLAANQDSDTIVFFRIDQQTGALTPTGEVVNIPTPVCVRMVGLP